MRFPQIEKKELKVLDLVPITNVVLLLVFFFLLSWSFVLQPGVEVRLPVSSLNSATQQGRHVVTLKMSGSDVLYFFDEKNMVPDEIHGQLKIAAEKVFGDWITLNADDAVPHGRVQQIASWAMELGLRVTIATQNASPGGAGA